MKSKTLIILAGLFLPLACLGQIHKEFFDPSSIRLLDVTNYLEPHVKWNMEGNIQASFNEGLNNIQDGNFDKAALNFSEVIQMDRSFAPAYYYRGVCAKKKTKFREALDDFIYAAKNDKHLAEAHIEAAEIYQLAYRYDDATVEYTKALTDRPDYVHAFYGLGLVAMDQHKIIEARRQFQKCREVDPHFAPAYVADALVVYQQSGANNELLGQLNKAIQVDSTYIESYFWRGLFVFSLQGPQQALPDWNMAVQTHPNNAFMRVMRGYLYTKIKKYDEAFADFRRVLLATEINENKFSAGQTPLDKKIDVQTAARYVVSHGYGIEGEAFSYLKEGFCQFLVGDAQSAFQRLGVSARMEPSSSAYYLMALLFEHAAQHNLALIEYSHALELDNDIFDAHKKRAIYNYELRKWDQVEIDFKDMERLQPGSPVVYHLRGMMLSQKGDYAEATKNLSRYLSTDSTDSNARETLALCLNLSGDYRGSNEQLDKLIPENSNGTYLTDKATGFLQLKAKNYLGVGDTATAIMTYNRMITQVWNPTTRLALGRIYIAQQNWKKANYQLTHLFAPGTHWNNEVLYHSEASFFLGLIELKQLHPDQAIDQFNSAIKQNPKNNEARYNRALLLAKQHKTDLAIQELESLKEADYPGAAAALSAISR